MSTNAENAAAMLKQGFNCAQSVLASCGTRFGLGRDAGLKAAAGFGGGMGRTGNVCGALVLLGGLYLIWQS